MSYTNRVSEVMYPLTRHYPLTRQVASHVSDWVLVLPTVATGVPIRQTAQRNVDGEKTLHRPVIGKVASCRARVVSLVFRLRC